MDVESIETYVLELSGECNCKCLFCYSISFDSLRKAPRRAALEGARWINALENLANNGAKNVDFSGGEPTLHPDFEAIARRARQLGLYTILSTNGSTAHSKKIKRVIGRYIDCIAISLHDLRKLHDRVMGKNGLYERARKIIIEYGGRKRVKVNSVVHRANLSQISQIGEEIKIDCAPVIWKVIQVIPREAGNHNKGLISITDEEFHELKNRLSQLFPKAFHEGRLVFREDDSRIGGLVPYVISDSQGELYVPVGEQHLRLGVSVFEPNLKLNIREQMKDYGEFCRRVRANHQRSYGLP